LIGGADGRALACGNDRELSETGGEPDAFLNRTAIGYPPLNRFIPFLYILALNVLRNARRLRRFNSGLDWPRAGAVVAQALNLV